MSAYGIKFISGKYAGGEFRLPDEGELLIGRASDLDLVLVEDMVSRKHAKLACSGTQLTISDLGSTNGTFVNGEKVRRANLSLNDRILVGTSILKVIRADDLALPHQGADDDAVRSAMRDVMQELGSREDEPSTMSGELEEVPLPDLLQLFATNRKSGVLSISGANSGKIFIKGGQIEYASIGDADGMRPMKALCRMVGWEQGAFRVDPYEGEESFPETFGEPTESVLIEALRQMDELRNLQRRLPEPEAELALCVPLTPKLSALDAAELDALQLALNFVSIQQVLDNHPETDHTVVTLLAKLLQNGYLEIA